MEDVDVIIRNQIALINLVSALSEKLTGQTPEIRIELPNGYMVVTPVAGNVTWSEGISQ